jgi:deoxyribodipyrimidine photo-lyase
MSKKITIHWFRQDLRLHDNPSLYSAFEKGMVIPIVDAGMRQLWETGYIHNRVRMIVGSFLVKNLLLH